MIEGIILQLKEIVGPNNASEAPCDLIAYSRDWSLIPSEKTFMPDYVVRPQTTEEVAEIVKLANKHRIPVIPYGGGTGMAGGAIAHKGIVLCTKALNKIIEIDSANMTVTTQAGVTVAKLNEELAKHGLWWPHDPESKLVSTVGATISVDSIGTFGIKYGKAVDYLLSAVVVLPTGEIMRLGHKKAHTTCTGYKLHWLLIGAEGTLGVITEATLRVFPLPKTRHVDIIAFNSLNESMKALIKILSTGLAPEAALIACRRRIAQHFITYEEKFGRKPHVPSNARSFLILSWAGDERVVKFFKSYTDKIVKKFDGFTLKERKLVDVWWTGKHTLQFEPFKNEWPMGQREKRFGGVDIGLPIARLDDAYRKFEELCVKYNLEPMGLLLYNMKPNGPSATCSFAVNIRDTDDEIRRYEELCREMLKFAVDIGGTMSSYMGDGMRFLDLKEYEHGRSIEYMKKIKRLFDPNNIMNPGKKFC